MKNYGALGDLNIRVSCCNDCSNNYKKQIIYTVIIKVGKHGGNQRPAPALGSRSSCAACSHFVLGPHAALSTCQQDHGYTTGGF